MGVRLKEGESMSMLERSQRSQMTVSSQTMTTSMMLMKHGAQRTVLALMNQSKKMSSADDTTTKEPQFLGAPREHQPPKQPVEYFRDFIDTDILQTIVTESSRYSLQCDITKPLALTQNELEQFIGMIFYMSIVKIPRARLYWSPTVRCPEMAETMPMKRFEDIKTGNCLRWNSENKPIEEVLSTIRQGTRKEWEGGIHNENRNQ